MPKITLTPRATLIMGAAAAAAFVTLFVLFAITMARLEAYAEDAAALRVAFNEANRRAVEGGQPPVEQPPKPPEQPPVVGPAPRGIADALCQDNGRWRVIYTDGTTVEDAGPCAFRGPIGLPGKDSTVPGPSGRPGKDSTVPGPSGRPGGDSTIPGPSGRPGADSTVPGPSGKPGADSTVPGPPGKDSTVPGPTGPSGRPGSDGGDGRDGQDGKDGKDGRGIAEDGMKCVDGRWQITYTDGTTDPDAGPCTPQPGPTVTVTPPPTEEETDR